MPNHKHLGNRRQRPPHPMQLELRVGPTGRTISRQTLLVSGFTEALLWRLALAGALPPIAGTDGRQFDEAAWMEMWRHAARLAGKPHADLSDVEALASRDPRGNDV